jgi:hypothetical protein
MRCDVPRIPALVGSKPKRTKQPTELFDYMLANLFIPALMIRGEGKKLIK